MEFCCCDGACADVGVVNEVDVLDVAGVDVMMLGFGGGGRFWVGGAFGPLLLLGCGRV